MLSGVIVWRVSAAVCFSLFGWWGELHRTAAPLAHKRMCLSAGACLSRWWPTASTETSCVPQVRLCFFFFTNYPPLICVCAPFLPFLFSILTLIQTDHSNMSPTNICVSPQNRNECRCISFRNGHGIRKGLQVDMRFCLKHVLTCKRATGKTVSPLHACMFMSYYLKSTLQR